MRRARSTSAFTLMELILVMLIIAIVVAIAAPSMAGFARGRIVADAAAHFTAVASFGGSRAVAEGKVYRLSINTATGEYSVTHDDGTGQNFVATDSMEAQPVTLPDTLKIDTDVQEVDGAHVIEFQPQGRTDPATVHITDVFGNSVTIACTSPFGYFHITTGSDAVGGRP